MIIDGEENKSNSENEQMQETEEEKKGVIDASYTTETNIAYSAGNDSDWSYGNQIKEFPIDDASYVRIASTAITDKNKGVDNEITVTYRFTGTKNCQVNLSDGIAEQIDTGDAIVTEFTRTIFAKKSKETEEIIIISSMFRRRAPRVLRLKCFMMIRLIQDTIVETQYILYRLKQKR